MADDRLNKSSKALGGRASFFVGLSRALVSYRAQIVQVRVDGEDFYEGPMVSTAIANGQFFGGGMHFARDARIDDGVFHIVTQTKAGPKEVAKIRDLYSGKIADWDSVRIRTGSVVEATSEEEVLLDIDGEQPGRLDAKFELVKEGVRLIGL